MKKVLEANRKYYSQRFSKFGADVRTFWSDSASQIQRFDVLAKIGKLEGKTILDVGCGFGDLYDYLVVQQIEFDRYIGVDLNSDIIDEARRRYPGGEFHCADILEFESEARIDYSLASGIFALAGWDWEESLVAICKKMFAISRVGIGINLLSSFTPISWRSEDTHYSEPWETLKLLMQRVSSRAVLRHNYRTNDYTIFLYWENK